ncbi:urease accessory protein, partial [Streptomyces rubiginosohelvolus]
MYREDHDTTGPGTGASGPGTQAPAPAASAGAAQASLAHLLVGLQLTDSAFPSGFYTLSHSLEGFAQA